METMTEKILKVGKQFREFTVARADVDEKKRTVALSFSTTPVKKIYEYDGSKNKRKLM